MKKIFLLMIGLTAFAISGGSHSQDKKDDPFKKLMIAKLHNAQSILEGMVTNDFKKVNDSAENLMSISNRAEWFALKTLRFKLHSNDFRRHLENIIKKAKQKNVDGVALGYVEMTMTCVRCHQYVRDVADVRIDDSVWLPAKTKLY